MTFSRPKLKQTAIFASLFVTAQVALDRIEGEPMSIAWYATGLVAVAVLHLALTARFGD